MFTAVRIAVYGFLFCVCSSLLLGASAPQIENLPIAGQGSTVTPSSSVSYAAMWKTSNGYTTTLLFSNGHKSAVNAQISLYSVTGQQVGSTQVLINENQNTRVSLSELFEATPLVNEGGLSIAWRGDIAALSAEVLLTDPAGSTVSYPLKGAYRDNTENMISSPWWLPGENSNASIRLFNADDKEITISPSVLIDNGETSLPTITLAAKASRDLSLRDLLRVSHLKVATVGALRLKYTGPEQALQPLFLVSDEGGVQLMPTFCANHKQYIGAETLWGFPYVMTAFESEVKGLSNEAIAYALLSNQTSRSVVSKITALQVNRGAVQESVLADPVLSANETRLINLSELSPQAFTGAARMGLTVTHSGRAGDVDVSVFTMDGSEHLMHSSRGWLLPATGTSISYWDVSGKALLLHHLKSISETGGSAIATLYFEAQDEAQSYDLPTKLSIAKDEIRSINISQIIHVRVTDKRGIAPPAGLASGLIVLSAQTNSSSSSAGHQTACLTSCSDEMSEASSSTASPLAFVPACSTPHNNTCFAQLKYRPLNGMAGFVSNHAFWWVQDDSGRRAIIDGGPNCGQDPCYLVDWVAIGAKGSWPTRGHYAADNPNASTAWSVSGTSSTICDSVETLIQYSQDWNQTQYIYYATSQNSNTFAHWAGTAAGFSPTQPPSTPGW